MAEDKDKTESGPWQKYASSSTAVSDEHGPWDNYGTKTQSTDDGMYHGEDEPKDKPTQEPWYQRFPRALLHSVGLPETLGDVPGWATQGIPGLDKNATHLLPQHKEDYPIIGPISKAIAKPTNENITGAIPLIGPPSVEAAKSFGKGDYASGLGHLTAAVSPAIAPAVMESAISAPQTVSKALGKVNAARTGLAENAVAPLVYENVGESAADRRMGINAKSGIVNEGHAGTKQMMLDQAKERTTALKNTADSILQNHPNSGVPINVEPIIDQAIDEAVAKAEKVAGGTERLENLRTALKTKFGPTTGTPFEINNMATEIQKAAKELGAFGNTQPAEASAAAAMKNVAKRARNEVNHHIPEVKDFNERMANSLDAQSGLQRKIDAEEGQSIFGGHLEGTIPSLLNRTLGSAPVRSGVARLLNLGLTEGVPEPWPARSPAPPIPPFRAPVTGPTPPPAVPPNLRVQPIGSPTSTTQLGTRGAGGVRNVAALPQRAESLIPPVQPTVPEQFRTEVPGTEQNEFQLGPSGQGGTVIPPVQGGVKGLLPGPAPKGLLPPIPTELPPPGTAELAHPELFPRKNPGVPAMSRLERGKGGRMTKVFSGERVPEVTGRTAEGGPITEPAPPPPAISEAIQGTDWKFEGKNKLGLYTIQEPGTKIRISLFERELQPEFIKRKIAEKEKQFGAPEKGKKQGEVNF